MDRVDLRLPVAAFMLPLVAPLPATAAPPSDFQIPTAIVSNQGQFDARARFVARHDGMTAFFLDDGVALRLAPARASGATGAGVFLTFEGASADVATEGVDLVNGTFNYFIGDDPASWRTDVPGYSGVRYRGMYPGVDVQFRMDANAFEYDLLCASASDVARVVVKVDGAEGLGLDPDGRLAITTAGGVLHQEPPHVFALGQDGARTPVDCRVVLLEGERFAFALGACDADARVVVDPALGYSTYLGGTAADVVNGVAVNGSGQAYLVGTTSSPNFPAAGGFDSTLGMTDAFLVKLDAGGTGTFIQTYFGGSATVDAGMAVALDSSGEIFVVGSTQATVFGSMFPTTPGAFDTTHSGGMNHDGFVAKFNAAGSALIYSTLLGGSFTSVNSVAVASDTAYVTGFTFSPIFPTTAGAFDTSFGGGAFACDAFVTRLNASGSGLLYSSFLGNDNSEVGQDIAVDGTGKAYVVGLASAPGFGGTAGVIDATVSGAFVVGVNSTGSALTFATGLGGASEATSVALSGSDLVVTGFAGAGLLTTPTAYDTSFNGGTNDAFVVKLNNAGTLLHYGTYLGGAGNDVALEVAVDGRGNAHVHGGTTSAAFPVTPGGPQQALNGASDAFVAKLDPKGEVLMYGTYLGGAGLELSPAFGGISVAPGAIAVDAAEAAYVGGVSDSADFPVTAGAFDVTANGVDDGYATKAVTRACAANAASSTYGSGKAGANGVPVLDSINLPYVGATTGVRVTNGKPFATPLLFLGLSPLSLPFDGGTLLVNPTWTFTLPAFDVNGALTLVATLPDDPSFCGIAIYHQVIFGDPGASGFYHTAQTNGLVRTLGS